jgi:hypothetical protein
LHIFAENDEFLDGKLPSPELQVTEEMRLPTVNRYGTLPNPRLTFE